MHRKTKRPFAASQCQVHSPTGCEKKQWKPSLPARGGGKRDREGHPSEDAPKEASAARVSSDLAALAVRRQAEGLQNLTLELVVVARDGQLRVRGPDLIR